MTLKVFKPDSTKEPTEIKNELSGVIQEPAKYDKKPPLWLSKYSCCQRMLEKDLSKANYLAPFTASPSTKRTSKSRESSPAKRGGV